MDKRVGGGKGSSEIYGRKTEISVRHIKPLSWSKSNVYEGKFVEERGITAAYVRPWRIAREGAALAERRTDTDDHPSMEAEGKNERKKK